MKALSLCLNTRQAVCLLALSIVAFKQWDSSSCLTSWLFDCASKFCYSHRVCLTQGWFRHKISFHFLMFTRPGPRLVSNMTSVTQGLASKFLKKDKL